MKREVAWFVFASALALPALAATTITFQYSRAVSTGASAINNNGDIAGGYTDAAQVHHGFRRTAGGVFTSFDVPARNHFTPPASAMEV
jgi:hypothetical protein